MINGNFGKLRRRLDDLFVIVCGDDGETVGEPEGVMSAALRRFRNNNRDLIEERRSAMDGIPAVRKRIAETPEIRLRDVISMQALDSALSKFGAM